MLLTNGMAIWERVIWAVDPFEGPGELRDCVVQTLLELEARAATEIQPVYVLSPSELNLSVDLDPLWIEQYRPAAATALQQLAATAGLGRVAEPQVLGHGSSSIRDAVRHLTAYAEQTGADLIVAGTHGRRGVSRLLMGSFAETMVLHSPVPILVVGPESRPGLDHIVFATDLGDHSRLLFDQAIRLAHRLDSRLTVFHALPNPVEPIFQSGMFLLGGAWVPVHHYFSEDAEQRRSQVNEWVERARREGVDARAEVDESGDSVMDSLLGCAERQRAGLIALAAQSGPWKATFIGSVPRQVVRHARCPVWILHPETEGAEKKGAA
jgi:nucleotide-binding universal stress UspA family protein